MELSDIWQRVESLKSYFCFELPASGAFSVKSEELYKNISYENVTNFFATRHSFRNFLSTPVDDTIMRKVIRLAIHAPSACNRQPCKIYYTSDEMKVIKISHFIEGIRGFEDAVPNWAVVTADRDLFRKTEYFQWYVNGGIFLGYFLQALHACHLGSCTFQTPINYSGTQKLRAFVGIPENETIIAAVGYGYIPKETKVICSSRKAEDKVLVKL